MIERYRNTKTKRLRDLFLKIIHYSFIYESGISDNIRAFLYNIVSPIKGEIDYSKLLYEYSFLGDKCDNPGDYRHVVIDGS